MNDGIRPIKVHPRTVEVMREIGMALTEMIIDENVPKDPQLMGIAMPVGFASSVTAKDVEQAWRADMECSVCGSSEPHGPHDVVGTVAPGEKVVTVQAGGVPEDGDTKGDRKRLDDLLRLDEFLRETPGTGLPDGGDNTTVGWAIQVIQDLLQQNKDLQTANQTLTQAAVTDEQLRRIGQLMTENSRLSDEVNELNRALSVLETSNGILRGRLRRIYEASNLFEEEDPKHG